MSCQVGTNITLKETILKKAEINFYQLCMLKVEKHEWTFIFVFLRHCITYLWAFLLIFKLL